MAKLSRDVAELEGQLDRAQRDKQSLTKQLEETFCKLSSQEQDRNKVVFASVHANLHYTTCSSANLCICFKYFALSSLTKPD